MRRWPARRHRDHPWLFILAFGTMTTALAEGDLPVAGLCAIAVVWLVRRA